jgi:hypothetical protein
VIDQAALHQVDEMAGYSGAQDVGSHEQDTCSPLPSSFHEPPAQLGQGRMGECRGTGVEGEQVGKRQVMATRGQRLDAQTGTIENRERHNERLARQAGE